ncbi:MAG TPA: hypothetical protein VMD30_07240 [Tepidisphaeraceae bacterium]|nr:hypothetical protein [Tepidisphaeraceae bacterium]
MRLIALILPLALILTAAGCKDPPTYGTEVYLEIPGHRRQIWAIAPAINLSGHAEVDPILQADLLYEQLQDVHGMTVVPVDRVVQVFAALRIDRIESFNQAAMVCDLLHADAIVVPTVMAFDPYVPPKMGASLALFRKTSDPNGDLKQSVGMFDSADGSVRDALLKYSDGRTDPNGPMADREYFLSMDRYCGFVYHQLIADLLGVPAEPIIVKSK